MSQTKLSDHEWRQKRRQMTCLVFDPVPETPVLSRGLENEDRVDIPIDDDQLPSINSVAESPVRPLLLTTSSQSEIASLPLSHSRHSTSSTTLPDPIFDITNLESAIADAQTVMRKSILRAVTEATTRVEREADLIRRQAQAVHLNQMELLQDQIHELQAQACTYETMGQHREEILERLSQYCARHKQQLRIKWSEPHSVASCFHGWKRWWYNKKQKLLQQRDQQKQTKQIVFQQWKLMTQQCVSNQRINMLQQQHEQEKECLRKDYEAQMKQLQQELDKAKEDQLIAQQGRQQLEDDLRKVFLRGVSAINMEAMHLFESKSKENGATDNHLETKDRDSMANHTSTSSSLESSHVQFQKPFDDNELNDFMIPIRSPTPQPVDMSTKLQALLASSSAKLPPPSPGTSRFCSSQSPIPTARIHGLRSADLVEAHQRLLHVSTSKKSLPSSEPSSNQRLTTKQHQRKLQNGLKYQVEMDFLRSSVTSTSSIMKRISPGTASPSTNHKH